jgi:type III secretion apparatus needle protein
MNLDEISAAMSSLADRQSADDELKRMLEKLQQNPQDPKHLIDLQAAMQKWNMAIETQSDMIKKLGDALKDVIQKMG